MLRLHKVPDDFEATVRILPEPEGGRTSAPRNGIRWDFSYGLDSEPGVWMIWPDFFGATGDSLPTDQPLPVDEVLNARFTVVDDELRKKVHRSRILVGLQFYCVEGPKRVAVGTVTRITGLTEDRPGVLTVR